MRESKWTDELVDQLKNLYLEKNLSTIEIAKQLGFTKNAIIGKIHRIGIVKKQEETNPINSKFKVHLVKPKVVKEQGKYLLEELSYNMCVWPYGDDDFTFCGEKSLVDKPYCQEHSALVYLPPKQISKRKASEVYTASDMEADDEVLLDDVEEEEEIVVTEEVKDKK